MNSFIICFPLAFAASARSEFIQYMYCNTDGMVVCLLYDILYYCMLMINPSEIALNGHTSGYHTAYGSNITVDTTRN